MSRLRKLLIVILGVCMAVCLCLSVAACGGPDIRDPGSNGDQTGDPDTNGKYVVNVKSAGGIPLNGVEISVKKNGSTFKTLISIKGQVSFELDPDVYELVVNESTLPDGYYIPEGTTYKTSADSMKCDIAIPSKVITTTATSGTVYKLGDVMHDFVATDSDGTQYRLSTLLETKKAVMINCWGTTCVPCQVEFPAIQSAYNAYSDKIEILALSSYNSDTETQVNDFKQSNGYTFPMMLDYTGIYKFFNVTAYPTSIIIDRYGVVAYVSSGTETSESIWKALFNNYTSDNYVQTAPDESGEGEQPDEWTKPSGVEMPASADIAAAINGIGTGDKVAGYYPETNELDKEYTWPWVLAEGAGGKYLTASNSKVKYSYATIYVDITLRAGDTLSFEYNVDTESGNDVLYVLIDEALAAEYSGDSNGWQTEKNIYTASYEKTIKVAFCYIKNASLDVGSDTASIRNVTIGNLLDEGGSQDVKLAATYNSELDAQNKYDVKLELDEQLNYYFITYTDEYGAARRSLLLADILNSTLWAEKHVGAHTFVNPENSDTTASMYQISFWLMSNYRTAENDGGLIFTYGHTDVVIESFYVQQDITDYSLVPVTPELKAAMEAFVKEFYNKGLNSVENDVWYEDQWLELCYFYRHYGDAHDEDSGEQCWETMDPLKGYLPSTAYTANEGSVMVDVDKATMHNGGGRWYTFVPEKTGVYLITTTPKAGTVGVDPTVRIYAPDDVISIYNNDIVAQGDDDLSYDCLAKTDNELAQVKIYVELEAGTKYTIQANLAGRGAIGSFSLNIEYAGEYVEYLRLCSTGYGAHTTELDEEGNMLLDKIIYQAIPVTVDTDGYYYAVKNNDYGSPIYIDFIRPNCFDISNHTPLIDIINHGEFNFTAKGGQDYTDVMLDYYKQSIEGKSEDDLMYGMLEASQELVNVLNLLVAAYDKYPETTTWLSFACYFEYYGTPSAN